MTQNQSYGLLVILTIFVIMFVRSREVTPFQAVTFSLFGFVLALTGPGYAVDWVLQVFFGAFK